MKTYRIYQVEAFEKYDQVTQNYYNVKKIEVIADDEQTALAKARAMLQANNYEVRACIERPYDPHSK